MSGETMTLHSKEIVTTDQSVDGNYQQTSKLIDYDPRRAFRM